MNRTTPGTALMMTVLMLSALAAGPAWAIDGPAGDASNEAAPGDEIIGLWATDKAEAHVEIYKTDNERYSGRIVWLKDPFYPDDDPMAGEPKIDRENPDPALRGRAIEGLEIIRDFKFDGDRRWNDGEIYDPENGKTYSSKMWLTDEGTLKVRGYVGISLFGRTTEWTPVLGGFEGDGEADAGDGDNADDGEKEARDQPAIDEIPPVDADDEQNEVESGD